MSELIKEAIRRVLWFITPPEMLVKEGTLKFRFLNWLYGNAEPYCDGWIYPK